MTDTKKAVKLVGSAQKTERQGLINAAQTQLARLELIKADKKYTLTIKQGETSPGNATGKRAWPGSAGNDPGKRARTEPTTPSRDSDEEVSEVSEED